ncbi:MAG: helix-turn-helix transcriptional regulator, partial [Chloroflexi bacterium]|nr:helix-turn-helix transcriptional regulator [Chloroflexota bacterium]
MRAKSGDINFANRIKILRKDLNLTQEKLAEKADITLPLLQKIENASILGSRITHQKLADALGVSVTFLVYGEKEKPKSRIPDLPPDIELTPEQSAQLEDLIARGLLFSKPLYARLSNRQLLQIIE